MDRVAEPERARVVPGRWQKANGRRERNADAATTPEPEWAPRPRLEGVAATARKSGTEYAPVGATARKSEYASIRRGDFTELFFSFFFQYEDTYLSVSFYVRLPFIQCIYFLKSGCYTMQ